MNAAIIATIGIMSIAQNVESVNMEKLILAIEKVESGGKVDAVGDGGRAVGCLQIWPIMVDEVNRIAGTKYTLKDRLSRQKSFEMARIYLNKYGKTTEEKARNWNGGPNGYKKDATKKYWNKVKKELSNG